MRPGYAFELDGGDWRAADDESWEIVVYSPTGQERHVGERRIDGTRCRVYRTADGRHFAQTAVYARVGV